MIGDRSRNNGTGLFGGEIKGARQTICYSPARVLILVRSDTADAQLEEAFSTGEWLKKCGPTVMYSCNSVRLELDEAVHPGILLLILGVIQFVVSISLSRGPWKAKTDSEANKDNDATALDK